MDRWISAQGRDGRIYIVTPKGYLKDAVEDGAATTIANRELVA
jgi:hypothetical protein